MDYIFKGPIKAVKWTGNNFNEIESFVNDLHGYFSIDKLLEPQNSLVIFNYQNPNRSIVETDCYIYSFMGTPYVASKLEFEILFEKTKDIEKVTSIREHLGWSYQVGDDVFSAPHDTEESCIEGVKEYLEEQFDYDEDSIITVEIGRVVNFDFRKGFDAYEEIEERLLEYFYNEVDNDIESFPEITPRSLKEKNATDINQKKILLREQLSNEINDVIYNFFKKHHIAQYWVFDGRPKSYQFRVSYDEQKDEVLATKIEHPLSPTG